MHDKHSCLLYSYAVRKHQVKIYQDLIKMVSIGDGACKLSIKKAPNQAKIYQDLIKMVSVTLEKLWLVSDRIADFRFFIKFHRSGPTIIFSFSTIVEHVSYPSKKLQIKPRFIRTLSRS